MKSVLKLSCLTLIILSLGTCCIQAQNNSGSIGTSVPFLRISPDARSAALGEAGVAISNDANAMHWNPSALGFVDNKMGLSLSYTPWFSYLIPNMNHVYLSGFYNLGEKKGVLGASIRHFSTRNFAILDSGGNLVNDISAHELALNMGYAYKITPTLSASVALRYIYGDPGGVDIRQGIKTVNSISGDISLTYVNDFKIGDIPIDFRSGLNISNIGPRVNYLVQVNPNDPIPVGAFIPTNLRVGYALKAHLHEDHSLSFTNDFNKLLVTSKPFTFTMPVVESMLTSFVDAEGGFSEEISEITTSLGLEYSYKGLLAARVGYLYQDPLKGNRKFITMGAGIKYKGLGFDFAYLVPMSENQIHKNTFRLSLAYSFQSEGEE